MSEKDGKNPIQSLTDVCGELQRMADSLRTPSSDPSDNDIPDIYDLAASLFTAIITCKAGYDPNQNILQEASEFESQLISKEQEFTKKMEYHMNELALKNEEMHEKYHQLENNIEKACAEIPTFYQKALAAVEERNARRLAKLEEELHQKAIEYAKQEETLKEGFEDELANHLKQVNDEWVQKIKDKEQEASQLQKELHLAIHAKQEQILLKNEEMRKLERANSEEIENETKTLDALKREQLQILDDLNKKLEDLNKQVADENAKVKTLSDDLEKQIMDEKRHLSEEYAKELVVLERKQKDKMQELINIQNEFEQNKASANLKIKEKEASFDMRLQKEKETTEKQINEVRDRLKAEYVSLIDALNQKLLKAEYQRGLSLEQLHQSTIEKTDNGESQIMEMNRLHQEERDLLRKTIRQEKQKLQELLTNRENDVDMLKRNLEQQVKDAEDNYANAEARHKQNVNQIMDKFAALQKQYDEDKTRRIAEKEARRVEEIARLKGEHQLRVNEIVFRMEQKTKIHGERAFNEGIKEATIIHQQELNVIKTRINDYNNDYEDAKKSLIVIEQKHKHKMEEIERVRERELENRMKVINDDFENEKSQLIRDKKVMAIQLKKAQKKKEAAEEQLKVIKERLEETNTSGPIVSPIDVLKQSFNKVISEMRHQEADLIINKRTLEKQIGALQNSIDELGQLVDQKQAELDEFRESRRIRLKDYLNSIQTKAENDFNLEKQKPIDFEASRIPLRKQMDDEIAELQKSFLKQKEEAEQETVSMTKEKETKIKELEKELDDEFEKKIGDINTHHEEVMKRLNEEYDNLKLDHERRMIEIQQKYETDLKNAEQKHLEKKKGYQDEKRRLVEQQIEIQQKIEETPILQCTDCKSRKETINRLIQRRNELLDRYDETTTTNLQTDQKVSSIFPKRVNASSKSSLALTHTQTPSKSPRVTKVRNKSSLKKPI